MIEQLTAHGAIYLKDVLGKDLSHFLTHALLRWHALNGTIGDPQVPTAMALIDHELFLETAQERIWPLLEIAIEEELLPTYSYSRLYSNGDLLAKHKDRPACEISVTVQLGRSHHYSWPIFMGNHRFDIGEGDGVVYLGCDVEHWREKCDGPAGYYSGQAFFHFVLKNGKYAHEAGDSSVRTMPKRGFEKNRAFFMENK